MSAVTVHTVPRNAVINPETGNPVTAATALAAWLAANEPQLFEALAREAAKKAPGLGDWSSILSSISSGLSSVASDVGSAAESVGSYLTSSQGMQSLTSLASTYLQGQAAQQVTQLQLQRAQQGLAPAPVSYATNSAGQVVPVYTGAPPSTLQSAINSGASMPLDLGGGQVGYTLNGAQLQALSAGGGVSGFLQKYGLPLALVGGGLLAVVMLTRRR